MVRRDTSSRSVLRNSNSGVKINKDLYYIMDGRERGQRNIGTA